MKYFMVCNFKNTAKALKQISKTSCIFCFVCLCTFVFFKKDAFATGPQNAKKPCCSDLTVKQSSADILNLYSGDIIKETLPSSSASIRVNRKTFPPQQKSSFINNQPAVNQLGTVLNVSASDSGNYTGEELYGSALSAYEGGVKMVTVPLPVSVADYKNFIRVSDVGFVIAESCRSAKDKFFGAIDSEMTALRKYENSVNLNNMPRCFENGVLSWNEKIKNIFTICNNISSLYSKLSGECQLKMTEPDCMSIINAQVRPCEKYKGYFRYILASLLFLSAAAFLVWGLTLSGVMMILSSLLIFTSTFLAGGIYGWTGVLGYGLGFVTSLFNGIKGIFSFYTGGL